MKRREGREGGSECEEERREGGSECEEGRDFMVLSVGVLVSGLG